MALTFQSSIIGDILSVGGAPNYCYLYEPFGVQVTESDTSATKLFIDIKISNINALDIVIDTKIKYVEFDFSSVKVLSIDLMEIAQQMHNANIYKIGKISDIISSSNETILSKVMYTFEIYTDVTAAPSIIKKIPINGVREFTNYSPVALSSMSIPILDEFADNGIILQQIIDRWTNFNGIYSIIGSLTNLTTNASSTNAIITPTPPPAGQLREARGGMIFWKSRKGGWMFWGMDLSKKTLSGTHEGNLVGGMFRATADRVPYIPVNYTEVKSSYSIELKALALTQMELISVAGISTSPVVYYQADSSNSPLELMKLSSVSAPYTNLSNGGDFSVTLQSISVTSQKTY